MDKPKKIYYTMGEVAEMFDVNPSLIRFWEQKFDILKPDKNKKGNRLFTPKDVENLRLIYHLVKENGMTLAGAQKRIKESREGIEKNIEVVDKLQGIKSLLLEIKQELVQGGDQEILVDEAAVFTEIVVMETAGTVVPPAVRPELEPLPAKEPAAAKPEERLPEVNAMPLLVLESVDGTNVEPVKERAAVLPGSTPAAERPAEEEVVKRPRIIEQTLF